MTLTDLESQTREGLMGIAKDLGVPGYSQMKKQELIVKVLLGSSIQKM